MFRAVDCVKAWPPMYHTPAMMKPLTVERLQRKMHVINMGKNVKRWRFAFILYFVSSCQHMSSSSIIQSCGLCPGQTPHPSNDKCHDTASNCREAAKKNLCHKHGKKCKKVKIYIDRSYVVYQCRNVVLLFLHIQSCGLCSGQTPHPSNDKCRDTASNCREVARKNLCHQHGKKCKKVKVYCEAQGKGRAKGRPRKVTQRSFVDGGYPFPDALH